MYVCLCKSLTDGDISTSVLRGEVACMDSLRTRLGATTGCGRCEAVARECIDRALEEKQSTGQGDARSAPPTPAGAAGARPGRFSTTSVAAAE